MKIGITTFQYAHNYGALLQLVAMVRILKELGHQPEAINYIPPEAKPLPFWKGWGLKQGDLRNNISKRLIRFKHEDVIAQKFSDFIESNVSLSEPCYTPEEVGNIANNYDAIITGSDQVWRFDNSQVYFLEFNKPYQGKRISYAPSCGELNQTESRKKNVGQWLSSFDNISVRDNISAQVVFNAIGSKPSIVADPTLLGGLKDLAIKVPDIPDRYIFMYVLGKEIDGGHNEMIETIRNYYGEIPVVALVASMHKPQNFGWADHTVWDAGPGEWLYLVSKSSFVYTDSYHCSLFSIKEKKPFVSYYAEEKRAPRLIDMKERYQVTKSVASSVTNACDLEFWKQEYNPDIEKSISEHINFSLGFLKNALN